MMKMKSPWKATMMVKMYARGSSSSTTTISTPTIHVNPMITTSDIAAFSQFLEPKG